MTLARLRQGELYVPLMYADGNAEISIDAPCRLPGLVRFRFDELVAEHGWFCLPAEMFVEPRS